MGDGNDAVEQQQEANPAHAGVTTFYLVYHENFELLGGEFGGGNKYKTGIDPAKGPQMLPRDEIWPVGTEELQEAKKKQTVARFVEKHRVTKRFVYVFSVEEGKDPVFQFELFADAKGRVRYLPRDDFSALHGGDSTAQEQENAKYAARSEWKGGKRQFFEQKLPLRKHNATVKWFFFGMQFHLTPAAVKELEGDAEMFSPDPGFDPDATEKAKVEGLKVWKHGSRVPVKNGMLVRVFDPLHIAESMRAELGAKSDAFISYVMPAGDKTRRKFTERRMLVSGIAGSATTLLDRSNNVDLKEDTLKFAKDTWPKVKGTSFTASELKTLDDLTPKVFGHGHEFFLNMEKKMRDEYLRRQVKAATKVLLWLTGKPWAFVERQHYTSDARSNASCHLLLAALAGSLERVCDTDIGRNYVNALIEIFEDQPTTTKVPNVVTIANFVLRDAPPPAGLDVAKIAYKAGKTPYDFWSKLVTLYGAKNKPFLQKLAGKHIFDPALIKKISGLADQKQVFVLSSFVMARRLNRIYGIKVVESDITEVFAPAGKKAIVLYANNRTVGDNIDREFSVAYKTPDDLDKGIRKLQQDAGLVDPQPRGFRRLTFDHVATVTGFINLFFSARDLYISATEKGAFDVTKSSFNFLKSIYAVPWVNKKLTSRMSDMTLPYLSKQAGTWIAKRGVAIVAFALQAITVAFAAEDLWSKSHEATTEDTVGSAISLLAEVAVLIAAGMVVASGGTLTPAAAVVGIIGLALATAGFVYTLFIPTDQERALADCIFGKDFPSDKKGRPWQACKGNQLRFLNPAMTTPPTAALQNQISAFSNLMHNFNAKVELSDSTSDRAFTLTLGVGAVPRAAYFDIVVRLRWWLKGEPDDKTWTATLQFHYYPFPANVAPLASPQKDDNAYNGMHREGIVAPHGGPFAIFSSVTKSKDLQFFAYPKTAKPEYWSGTLENKFGGERKPVRVHLSYVEDYEVMSGIVVPDFRTGKREFRAEITLLPGMTQGLSVKHLAITLAFQQRGDGRPIGTPTQETFEPVLTRSRDGSGRDTLRLIVPLPDAQYRHKSVVGFSIQHSYEDLKLDESGIVGKGTTPMTPGVKARHTASIAKRESAKAYDLEVEFRARLVHTGSVAVVDFEVKEIKLEDPDDSARSRTDALALDRVVLQYVRNPGAGAPAEEGSGKHPIWKQMRRLGGEGAREFRLRNFDSNDGSPIQLLDKLAVRFVANLSDADGNVLWTEGPFESGLIAHWGWESVDDQHAAQDSDRIKSAACEVTMVMDGDPSTNKFMPNSITSTPPTRAPVEVTAEFMDVSRGLGVSTSSPEVAAIDACKTR